MEKNFTYGDYCRWPIDERWEIVNGIAHNMAPAPSRLHQNILLKLARVFADFLDDKSCEINIAPFDVRLPDAVDAGDTETFTVVQPDLLIVCDLSKLDDRGCKGAPDLIIEILSPATAARDFKIKRDLYEKHCVQEYWLVHPTDKTIMIYHLGTNKQYAKALVYAGEDIVTSQVLGGLEINPIDLFGSLPKPETTPSPCWNKRQATMTIREQAKLWIKQNHPADASNAFRVSKYFPEKDIWFFTFSSSYFDAEKSGNLNILLQYENEPERFHFLKVPFSFFRDNQTKFDVRATGDKFDLHISAKKKKWLTCERSQNICFREYEQ